jgi:hypothetical protein
MNPAPRPNRHAARVPGLVPADEGAVEGAARRLFYQRLARVSVRHDYYAATGGACRDFSARPTGHTAMLLKRLGLLFREEDDGFSVLYNELQEESLLAYIRSRASTSLDGRSWARLCFVLSLRNPWFMNFTGLPVDTNPSCWNLYLTNRRARLDDAGQALLAPGLRVSARERVPVTGAIVVQPVGPGVRCVRVRSVSDTEVLCTPRCEPSSPPAAADPGDSSAWSATDACAERLYLDLGDFAEGFFSVDTEMADGAIQTRELLYSAGYPVPLGFVELLLADFDGAGGVYPVRGVAGARPDIACVPYVIAFAARSTWWNDYVVPDSPARAGGELRIRQLRAPGEPRVAFLGPCRIRLPGGRTAWRFVSRRPMALAQRPTLHLQLVRRREGSRRVDVLMNRLPLADGKQLVQADKNGGGGQALPCPCDGDQPGPRGRRLREWLSAGNLSPPGAPPRLFSDIYVHV